jgi:hypothetical protein
MKEYYENKWAKIIFVSMSLLMCAVALWIIFGRETILVTIGGVAMLALFLYTLINPFIHKIILDEDFIAEKSLFKSKQILFQEITNINIQSLFAEVISGKEKIHIGKFNIENSNEIVGSVISKIKDNERVLFGGDPILFQSYVNEFSGNKSLTEYNEGELTNFTFVENAELVERRWLFRVVNLTTSKGNFKITYFGKGMSYECVFVNDELVSKQDSHLWYVPKFNFKYQGMNISVNVRVYPWLTIRKFWIEVDNNTVYSE